MSHGNLRSAKNVNKDHGTYVVAAMGFLDVHSASRAGDRGLLQPLLQRFFFLELGNKLL